jgi:hypothetical protein
MAGRDNAQGLSAGITHIDTHLARAPHINNSDNNTTQNVCNELHCQFLHSPAATPSFFGPTVSPFVDDTNTTLLPTIVGKYNGSQVRFGSVLT